MDEFKIDVEAIGKKCFEYFESILLEKYGMTLDELAELCKAKQEGRLVELPEEKYEHSDGENALKSAMNTLFYHNNPVTRYIADAVVEKLSREEEAKLKEMLNNG